LIRKNTVPTSSAAAINSAGRLFNINEASAMIPIKAIITPAMSKPIFIKGNHACKFSVGKIMCGLSGKTCLIVREFLMLGFIGICWSIISPNKESF